MRVDRKCGLAEGLRHDDARGLVADTRKFLERVDVARNLTLIHDCLRHLLESPRLPWSESAASNQFQDFVLRHSRQCGGSRRATKKRGRDAIDLRVGRLRGQNDGDEQREWIAVAEGDGRLGVDTVEDFADPLRLFRACHRNFPTKSGSGGDGSV